MNEVSADTVMFFEPSMGKAIPVINPANEFLSQLQSPQWLDNQRILDEKYPKDYFF